MSRILSVGDCHFRQSLPYSSGIKDGRRSEWQNVKKKIIDTSNTVDAVVLLGDNLDSRNNPSIVLKEFVEFLKEFKKPVYCLIGNHERSGFSTALDFLQRLEIPNVHVFTDITTGIKIGDVTATFIPFMTPATLGVSTKEEAENIIINDSMPNDDICFLHHAIVGTANTEFFDEIMINKEKLEKKYKMSIGGHIHKPERLSEKIMVVGSSFSQEVNEFRKISFIWDTDKKVGEEVQLPCREVHKIIWKETDISKIPNNAIVKCYVTSRETDIEEVKKELSRFDSSIVIEQYPSERAKAHFDDGALDLSVENLLKLYGETKGVSYADLIEGFEIIKN